ncbi:hypothetical protein HKI87_16g84340 [Chloropicon roscoffensis]|uniref:Uncharacterized protein n=1 Tax=Chloropicon roscoffensis TaxID=1461544 RepID=A0AAX4PKM3_9CHLO
MEALMDKLEGYLSKGLLSRDDFESEKANFLRALKKEREKDAAAREARRVREAYAHRQRLEAEKAARARELQQEEEARKRRHEIDALAHALRATFQHGRDLLTKAELEGVKRGYFDLVGLNLDASSSLVARPGGAKRTREGAAVDEERGGDDEGTPRRNSATEEEVMPWVSMGTSTLQPATPSQKEPWAPAPASARPRAKHVRRSLGPSLASAQTAQLPKGVPKITGKKVKKRSSDKARAQASVRVAVPSQNRDCDGTSRYSILKNMFSNMDIFGVREWIFKKAEAGELVELKTAHQVLYKERPLDTKNGTAVWNDDTCAFAARGGKLETLKWLRFEAGCKWDAQTAEAAAWKGHLKVLKFCVKNGCEVDKDVFHSAVYGGHAECVRFLEKMSPRCDCLETHVCGDAARGGHIALLEELSGPRGKLRGRYPLCLETSALAARGDYPKTEEVFVWLRSRGCPWDKWTTASACGGEGKGSLQTLKFLHAQGVPLGKECFAKAAISGDLKVLEWLAQMGCPWDWTATHHAAEEGHLDALQWLRSWGCPWKPKTVCSEPVRGAKRFAREGAKRLTREDGDQSGRVDGCWRTFEWLVDHEGLTGTPAAHKAYREWKNQQEERTSPPTPKKAKSISKMTGGGSGAIAATTGSSSSPRPKGLSWGFLKKPRAGVYLKGTNRHAGAKTEDNTDSDDR